MKKLTAEQHHILIECGTEPPFSGKYWNHKEKGEYLCSACENKLFSSKEKFDSGTGWPSFWKASKNVDTKEDKLFHRTEIVCKKCGGHLGHVFNDGPKPTGLRYCVNSAALEFKSNSTGL